VLIRVAANGPFPNVLEKNWRPTGGRRAVVRSVGRRRNWRRTRDRACTATDRTTTAPEQADISRRTPARECRTLHEESDMGDDQQRLRELVAADQLLLTPEEAAHVLWIGRTTIY
jgi:hypothetical protein